MDNIFDYQEFTTRNIGFVTEAEQANLKKACVFIPGVGGMGGTALACLARAGVSNFIISDSDHFELSNLNRQIFANTDVIGRSKTEVAKEALLKINPEICIEIYDKGWTENLSDILKRADVVINGCDDIKFTIQLMRACQKHDRTAIDAFASPLPNVYVVKPKDKRPEELFGFPTTGVPLENVTKEMELTCLQKEIEHILIHSNSIQYVDKKVAMEIITGTRKRISFAPMVWITGCLMAYECIRILLDKKGGAGPRGLFFNPWTFQVERPANFLTKAIRKYFVRLELRKMI